MEAVWYALHTNKTKSREEANQEKKIATKAMIFGTPFYWYTILKFPKYRDSKTSWNSIFG